MTARALEVNQQIKNVFFPLKSNFLQFLTTNIQFPLNDQAHKIENACTHVSKLLLCILSKPTHGHTLLKKLIMLSKLWVVISISEFCYFGAG